jgi:protein-S-isoprenylcysteine O-methyltransferase Ste14
MSERATGWTFVGAQAVLIATLILLPGRRDFSLPDGVRTAADVLFWLGIALAVGAGLSLGRALTATPVPTAAGALRTDGLYRLVRHPIYSGVILIVIAMAVRSQSFVSLAVAAVTLVFFTVKARWEEGRLIDRYPEYPEYAARTPRFVPSVSELLSRRRDASVR